MTSFEISHVSHMTDTQNLRSAGGHENPKGRCYFRMGSNYCTVCCGPRRPLGFQHSRSPRHVLWGRDFCMFFSQNPMSTYRHKKLFGKCITIRLLSKNPKHLRYFISYLEQSCWQDRMRVGGGISMIKNLSAPSLSWPLFWKSVWECCVCGQGRWFFWPGS